MSTFSLTGKDSLIINDRVFHDFVDGDAVNLTYANDLANVKTGKDGNSIYAENAMGRQCELSVRLVRGSADDKFLNSLLQAQLANFSGFPLLVGEFTKRMGDGKGGNIEKDVHNLSGGIFTKQIPGKTNAEGDTEQGVAVYSMKFSQSQRAIT